MRSHEKFKKNAQAMLPYDINDKDDWRNSVRECPHSDCKLVWVKVEGCDGTTTCGSRGFSESLKYESKGEAILGWAWKKINGIYKYQKANKSQSSKKNDKFEATKEVKAAGCGRSINWSTMPVVSRERLKVLASTKELENVM